MLEQLVVVLFVALLTLLPMLIERLKTRQDQASQEDAPPLPPVPARTPTPLPARPVMLEAPASIPAPVVSAVPAPQPHARRGLGDRRALRRSIILMTLLGPCRALEAPPPRPSGTTPGVGLSP